MERLLIVGCSRTMDKICVGCSRCLVAYSRYEGEFNRYRGMETEVIGVAGCGDCPGTTIVPRLAQMKLCNAPLEAEPTKIHLAPCVVKCPHGEAIFEKLEARCGIEIVKGTHPYQMDRIFG